MAAFETFDRDTGSNGGDDLDMALLSDAGQIVASSLHGGSNEAVVLANPPAGNYKLCVIGYAAANGVSTDFTLSSAIVTRADVGGNLKGDGSGQGVCWRHRLGQPSAGAAWPPASATTAACSTSIRATR